jgi:hypothetical protein
VNSSPPHRVLYYSGENRVWFSMFLIPLRVRCCALVFKGFFGLFLFVCFKSEEGRIVFFLFRTERSWCFSRQRFSSTLFFLWVVSLIYDDDQDVKGGWGLRGGWSFT